MTKTTFKVKQAVTKREKNGVMKNKHADGDRKKKTLTTLRSNVSD